MREVWWTGLSRNLTTQFRFTSAVGRNVCYSVGIFFILKKIGAALWMFASLNSHQLHWYFLMLSFPEREKFCYEISMAFVWVSVFQILKQLTDFNGYFSEPYAIRGDSNTIFVNFIISVITTMRRRKLSKLEIQKRNLLQSLAVIYRIFLSLDCVPLPRPPHCWGFKITLI
jgi:hypothetical protein